MPYELFLALRYLRSRRRGRVARVTAVVAATTIATGVAALIIAFALANGFQIEIRDKILRGTAHITVATRDSTPSAMAWRAVIDRVREVSGVERVSASSYTGALLIAPSNNGAAYTVLRGFDPRDDYAVGEIRRSIISGAIEPLLRDGRATSETRSNEESGLPRDESSETDTVLQIIVGAELAARLNLRSGDPVQIVSAEGASNDNTPLTRTRRGRVAGIFRSDLYEYDATWSYVSLQSNLTEASVQSGITALSVMVADIYRIAPVEERIRAVVEPQGLMTVNWQEANRPLFAALELERRVLGIVIALIITIAALNIMTTLALVVIERRADIAILSAMGARAKSIVLIFLIEGAALGGAGAGLGVLLGLVACYVADRFKLVRLPADVYSISHVPLAPAPRDVLLAALVALVVSLLATVYPARMAARTRPAETLRQE
jgi:lipoprotein-releasing system permease protein